MGFLDGFFKIDITKDDVTKEITISGPLRLDYMYSQFRHLCNNIFYIKENNRCSFHQVFLPEVLTLFQHVISGNNVYANVVNLNNVIKHFTQENESSNVKYKYELDINIARKVMDKELLPYWIPIFKQYGMYKENTGNRGLLLYAGAGLGKTANSLAIAEMLKAKKILIISPNNAVYKVWVKSIVGYSNEKSEYKNPKDNHVYVIGSEGKYKDERFILTHYEAMEQVLPLINKIADKETVVIIDESHNFADPKSKRTNLLIDIIDKSMSNHILLLSGTPIKSYSTEIINLARIVNVDIRGDILNRLLAIYRKPVNFLKPTLVNRFQELSVVIEKEEANLPPVIKTYIPIKLKNGNDYTLDTIRKQMKEYIDNRISFINKNMDRYQEAYNIYLKQILKAGWESKSKYTLKEYLSVFQTVQSAAARNNIRFIPNELALCNKIEKEMSMFLDSKYRGDWHETKTILKYPMLKIQGECLGIVVMGARIKCHMDIARELDYIELFSNTIKKTIIFSNYIEVCDIAKNVLESKKFKPVLVYGNNTKNLTKEVDIFSKDKKRNPLITTYKSLSTAVPLTAANVIIAMDLPFRMYIFEQAIARVWRNGQDSQVLIYMPTLDTGEAPNINQRNFDIIAFFNEAVEEMTGFKSSVNTDETIQALFQQAFLNLESINVVNDMKVNDFMYTDHLDAFVGNRMILWR